MRKIRKIIGLLCAAMLVFALAACGQQAQTTEETSEETTTASQAAQEEVSQTPEDTSSDIQEIQVQEAGSGSSEATASQSGQSQESSEPTTAEQPEQEEAAEEAASGKTLVVYYSATGSTEAVAGYIADVLDANLFAITPAEPYSDADLDYTDSGSRVSQEYADERLRTVELAETTVENWDEYDTVFIGYPIWWGIAAWPTSSFVAANDFSEKTVIPFCTSASSGLGQSGTLLAELAGTGDWQEGMRFRSGVAESDVTDWLRELGLTA